MQINPKLNWKPCDLPYLFHFTFSSAKIVGPLAPMDTSCKKYTVVMMIGFTTSKKAHCCKPNNLPNNYLHCYSGDSVGLTFDRKGWSKCADSYGMAGIYRGNCDRLYCLQKFKCYSMHDGCKKADWWGGFDRKGWVQCDSSTQYITGLWRSHYAGPEAKISVLEGAKCCSAMAPNQNTPSTCQKVDWWGILDK